MNTIILSIFAIVVIMSFAEDYLPSKQKAFVLFIICIVLICTSGFKPMTTTDSLSYEYYYNNNDNPVIEIATEPTFIYLSRFFLSYGFGIVSMFLTFALIAIPVKLTALWKATPYVFTAMIIYMGVYYPLHDCVQIRCGVASSFLLMSIIPLAKRQYFQATCLTIIAILFHYSALAYIPILLVGNMKVGKYWKFFLGLSIPICLALYLMGKGAVSLIPSSMIEGKLDLYKETSETGDWPYYVPYKQIIFLAEFAMLYVFLYFYDTIEKYCIYTPILVKILVFEMGFLIMFSEIPVLGGRLHDLFGVFNILAFTCGMYCIKPKYAVRIGITVLSLTNYLIYMSYRLYFK